MKNILLLLSALWLSFGAMGQSQRTFKHLIGKWEGVDEGNIKGGLEFTDSTHVNLIVNGNTLPGLSYKIDFSKSPSQLDVIPATEDPANRTTIELLIAFVDEHTIKLQEFTDRKRTPHFVEDGQLPIIILKRVK